MQQEALKPGTVAVWDLPTRLFHWSLVGLIGVSWWSAEAGAMDWHRLSGLTVTALIIFRLIWGLIGGSTARFASFVRAPQHVIAHLRGRLEFQVTRQRLRGEDRRNGIAPAIGGGESLRPAADIGDAARGQRRPDQQGGIEAGLRGQGGEHAGHNPLGGYSVIALLLLIVVQVGTGLFAVDTDGLESGPLSYLVSFEEGRIASGVHEIAFALLQLLIVVHIAAILFYRFVKRRNLVKPMITGSDGELTSSAGALVAAPWWRFPLAAGIAAAFAWWTAGGMML